MTVAEQAWPPLLILSGGQSSRAGAPKALMPISGEPWLSKQVKAFRAAGGDQVVVVLGFAAAEIRAALPRFAPAVTFVVNEAPERGQFSSLQVGLAALRSSAVFCLPIDVPAPLSPVWQVLANALKGGVKAVMPTHQGRGGHPVLLSAALAAELNALSPLARLDEALQALEPTQLLRVEVEDSRVTMNLNSPEAWEQWTRST